MTESQQLLKRYTEEHSEMAFTRLVELHVNLVYSTALRLVGGNAALAQDITQSVFTTLAQKAATLPAQVVLSGWLYRHTTFVARQTIRTESRRQQREQTAAIMQATNAEDTAAWAQLEPQLDDALQALNAEDRDAILLRYFEQSDLRTVGLALGIQENAAKKRVTRAVDKLRKIFQQRSVTISATAFATLVSSHAVTAAPLGLASTIATAALTTTTVAVASTSTTFFIHQLMATTKVKIGLACALTVGIATPLVWQHQAQGLLEKENQALAQQVAALQRQTAENARTIDITNEPVSSGLANDQFSELLRLRGEVNRLRQEQREWQNAEAARTPRREISQAATNEVEILNKIIDDTTIPRESWAFAGYATPENALQSTMWAMSQGDVATYLASVTPEAHNAIAREFIGKSQDEIKEHLMQEIGALTALRPGNKKSESENEVTFVILTSEQDTGGMRMRDEAIAKFRKVGGEWKFAADE